MNDDLKSDSLLTCKICEKPENNCFKDRDEYRQHVEIEHGISKNQCAQCFRKFSRDDALSKHERIHEKKRAYFCQYCNASFLYLRNVTAHIRNVHLLCLKPPSLVAAVENSSCSSWSNGSSSSTIAGEGDAATPRPYHCQKCTASFTRSDHLTRHLSALHNNVTLTCQHCNASFGSKFNLKRHLKTCSINNNNQQSNQTIKHECRTCGRNFTRRNSLALHEGSHLTR